MQQPDGEGGAGELASDRGQLRCPSEVLTPTPDAEAWTAPATRATELRISSVSLPSMWNPQSIRGGRRRAAAQHTTGQRHRLLALGNEPTPSPGEATTGVIALLS